MTAMRLTRALLMGIGLSVCALPGAGAQSLYGPGGLVLHPAATVPPRGQLTPAILVLPQDVPLPGPKGTHTWISGSLDYGLADDVEIGVTTLNITDWPVPETSVGGYAKWRFLRESGMRPAAAAGFTMTGFGGTNTRQAFLAVRKQILGRQGKAPSAHPVFLNAGMLYDSIRDGIPRDDVLPYAGIEIGVARRLMLIAEGRPPGTADLGTPVAVSLAYQYGRAGRLVVTWANNGMSSSPRLGIGAGLGIGSQR
jgi:hypothetical protein